MTPEEKLDTLAEYEAQVTVLTLDKQKLLDEVKIPAEVQAIHDQSVRLKSELDRSLQMQLSSLEEQKKERLKTVMVPPDVQAVLDDIDRQRNQIEAEFVSQRTILQAETEKRKNLIDGEFSVKVQDVYAQVQQRKAEISTEFAGKIDVAQENIAKLTAEIKAEVVKIGKTIKSQFYQAVYNRGRITWNTDTLDGVFFALQNILAMIENFDQSREKLLDIHSMVDDVIRSLAKARKEGQPSVTLRKI